MKYASGSLCACRRHIFAKELIEILAELKCVRHAYTRPGAECRIKFLRVSGLRKKPALSTGNAFKITRPKWKPPLSGRFFNVVA